MSASATEPMGRFARMTKIELLAAWKEHFNQPAPVDLRKELLVPILLYRLQENEHGGLSQSCRKRLKQAAQTLRADSSTAALPSGSEHGTRLLRSWRGEVHEVIVLDGGFEYRGRRFGSLSQIAREITGTRWSGPLFFGTKKR